ncbi:MaoC family dehydratase [Streptomyces sp. NPDC050161]|uniref:MaoC family dehydratase n=1 Tax=Streptomyces sp. NPDC050161 TaxID=3365604 RepID=UPI00379C6B5C
MSDQQEREQAREQKRAQERPQERMRERAQGCGVGEGARPERSEPTLSWQGRYFEDFTVGDVYRHPLGRTVTTTDNTWLTLLTQNTAPLHFDAHYAAQTEFGKPLVDSTFTLALVTGQSVTDISQHVMANLGWDKVRLPHPVFEGDTLYSQSEVLLARASKSRPEVGVVTVRTVGFNQRGEVVIVFERTLLVYRRGYGPGFAEVRPVWDERSRKALS